MAGPIGDQSNFLSWLGQLADTTPIPILPTPQLTPEEQAVWIEKAEKAQERNMLALMPPMPITNLHTLHTISLDLLSHFSIERLGVDTLSAFGSTESAITLAAVGAWAEAQHLESEVVRELLTTQHQNPLEVTLNKYIESAQLNPVNALEGQLTLRNVPVLMAMLRTANDETVSQAFFLAQQQLILSMLDNWIEAEAKRAAAQREEAKRTQIKLEEIAHQMRQDYIKDAIEKQQALSQPALSIIFSSALGPLLLSVAPLNPAEMTILHAIPATVQTELSILTMGVLASAMVWAAPVALALTRGSIEQKKMAQDSADALALTLASLLTSPSFKQLLEARLDKAVTNHLIRPEQKQLISSTLLTSLLLHATALLYFSQHGGLSPKELQGLIDGSLSIEKENFLHTLAKLINEQLSPLSKKDREALLSDLLKFYETPFSFQSLTEPITSFLSLWDPSLFQEAHLSSKG